jgi:hypothetical protein
VVEEIAYPSLDNLTNYAYRPLREYCLQKAEHSRGSIRI